MPTVAAAVAAACAAGYPVLLLFVLGWSFSPFNPVTSWGLAAEHGELRMEHWSLFTTAILAALPLAVASRFVVARRARLLLASALAAALPYAVQPVHPFPSNDSWISNCTWQLGALEVALVPLLLAGATAGIAWLWRRAR